MKPVKFKINDFYDNRGFLLELIPNKIKLDFNYSIITISRKNVLRGMHYQVEPKSEGKLVRVTQGSIYDVIVDLRRNTKTFG